MGKVYHLTDVGLAWQEVTREGAKKVCSHLLLSQEREVRTRLSVTRIEPSGVFGPHIDEYEHVFCVLQGGGEALVGKERYLIEPGVVICTDLREPHGLWANKDEPLLLLTANIYPFEMTVQGKEV